MMSEQRNNAFWKHTPGHQLRVCTLFTSDCMFSFGGSFSRGPYIFLLHCDDGSFVGDWQMCIQRFEKQNMGGEQVFFVVLFIVDFTDLMMTCSQLPPTHRTSAGVYCIISRRGSTAAAFSQHSSNIVSYSSNMAICNTMTSELQLINTTGFRSSAL